MARRQLYKRVLAGDLQKTIREMNEQYEDEQAQAKKEGFWGDIGGGIGGLLGTFALPAIATLLAPATGGTSLLLLSMLGAAGGTYLGSKLGEDAAPGTLASGNIKGAEGVSLAQGYQKKLKTGIDEVEDQQETQRIIDSVTSGATAGIQGYTMGVDKYAAYLKNPLGHYIPSMRSKEQVMYAAQDAVKGLAPGTAEYDAALQSTGVDLFRPSGTVSPQVAAMPESLLSALPSLPDITTTRLPREVVNLAPVTSPAMNISEVIPNEPLYQNLLQAVTNPVIPSSYPLNPLDRY